MSGPQDEEPDVLQTTWTERALPERPGRGRPVDVRAVSTRFGGVLATDVGPVSGGPGAG